MALEFTIASQPAAADVPHPPALVLVPYGLDTTRSGDSPFQRLPADVHYQIFQYLFESERFVLSDGDLFSSEGYPHLEATIQNLMHYAISCKSALNGSFLFGVKAPYFFCFALCRARRPIFDSVFEHEDLSPWQRKYWVLPYTVKLLQECYGCSDGYILGGSHSRPENWFTTKVKDGKYHWIYSGRDTEKVHEKERGIKMSEDDLLAFRGLPSESEGDGMKRLRQWFYTIDDFQVVRETEEHHKV